MHPRLTPALLAATLAALSGCAHALPDRPPPSSAASTDARPAERAPVGRSLSSDPPLPGEPLDGWEGLAAPAVGSGGHGAHGGHHHAP